VGHSCVDYHQNALKCLPGYEKLTPGDIFCTPCAKGTFSDYGATTCTDCPAGSYCPSPEYAPIKCAYGLFSPIKSIYCSPCEDGKICLLGEVTASPALAANTCTDGFVCNSENLVAGTHTKIPCPPGYRSKASADHKSFLAACEICPAGIYCYAGTVINGGTACPKGHYCPVGTHYATQYPCPISTYNNAISKTLPADCLDCPSGSLCATPGTTDNTKFLCPPGHSCTVTNGQGDWI
jgi:hypothetical protein